MKWTNPWPLTRAVPSPFKFCRLALLGIQPRLLDVIRVAVAAGQAAVTAGVAGLRGIARAEDGYLDGGAEDFELALARQLTMWAQSDYDKRYIGSNAWLRRATDEAIGVADYLRTYPMPTIPSSAFRIITKRMETFTALLARARGVAETRHAAIAAGQHRHRMPRLDMGGEPYSHGMEDNARRVKLSEKDSEDLMETFSK